MKLEHKEPKRLNGVQNRSSLIEKAKERTYKWGDHIIEDDYCLYFDDMPIASYENIMLVFGREKSRKSLFVDCLTSSFFRPDFSLGFKGILNDRAIIHIDSEQPLNRFQKTRKRFYQMARPENIHNNYFPFNLRPFTVGDRIMVTEDLIGEIAAVHPVGLIIIDGVVDLCRNNGDQQAVNEVVEKLMLWTDQTKALMICVLHSNRGGTESNNILGSTLDKKVDVSFRVDMDENTHQSTIVHKLSRERRIHNIVFEQKKGLPQLASISPF